MPGKRRNPIHPIDRSAPASVVVDKFGGCTALATALGKTASTVQRWVNRGHIDGKHHADILAAAKRLNVKVKPADFVDTRPAADAA